MSEPMFAIYFPYYDFERSAMCLKNAHLDTTRASLLSVARYICGRSERLHHSYVAHLWARSPMMVHIYAYKLHLEMKRRGRIDPIWPIIDQMYAESGPRDLDQPVMWDMVCMASHAALAKTDPQYYSV